MNYAYLSIKGVFKPDELDAAIRQVVREKLQDRFTVDRHEDPEGLAWVIHVPGHPFWGLTVFLESSKKLSFRRSTIGDFMGWLLCVVQENLGAHYNGRCSDDALSKTWAPRPEKYPTFRSFFDMMHKHMPEEAKQLIDRFWEGWEKAMPEQLKPFLEYSK